MIAWTLFQNPMLIPEWLVLWLILPLCLAVAVVYKTVRINDIRKLPRQIAALMAYMVGGLVLLGAALWLVQLCFT